MSKQHALPRMNLPLLPCLSVAIWIKQELLASAALARNIKRYMDLMDSTTVEQEMAMLIAGLRNPQPTGPTYTTFQAPAPYSWSTDNAISHMEAISLAVTCTNPYPKTLPCGEYKRCITC